MQYGVPHKLACVRLRIKKYAQPLESSWAYWFLFNEKVAC
nr:MAG TPA: hypothetical protein [Caudoviricetes sp.]